MPLPQVVEYGLFVKHCKVEVYLLELKLCENSDPTNMLSCHFSKADTIGERRAGLQRPWESVRSIVLVGGKLGCPLQTDHQVISGCGYLS